MASASSRAFLLLVLLGFVALIGATSADLRGDRVAQAQLLEGFDLVMPEKLHIGDSSHGVGVLADANPGDPLGVPPTPPGRTGYCIFVDVSGITPSGGINGFTVANGTIFDTDFFTSGTTASNDDTYCVTVIAGSTFDAVTMEPAPMVITWSYTDEGGALHTESLEIELFEVRLEAVDGVVGGSAQVCTVNWDPDILTGFIANTDGTPDPVLNGTLPDPVDIVTLGADPGAAPPPPEEDWIIDPIAGPGAGTVEKLGQFRQAPDGMEWCMTFTADDAIDSTVTLVFYATYNPLTNIDDQLHGPFIDDVEIFVVPYSELRHVSPSGQLIAAQDSNENVIGSRHFVCIIPSDADDILLPADINFTGNGPSVTDLQIFRDGDPNTPDDEGFSGVIDGTICIGWVSSAPGEQFLDLKFTVVGGDFPGDRFVSWDSNDDNNDEDPETDGPENGSLIKQWNVIDRTEISTGSDPDDEDAFITFTRQNRGLQFNIADGTFFAGNIGLTEFVFGSHTGATGTIEALLDNVILEARIIGECGYFVVEGVDPAVERPTLLTGTSVQGRFDIGGGNTPLAGAELDDGLFDKLTVSITNDPGCNPASVLRVEIAAIYPGPIGSSSNVVFGTEWVEFAFTFTPAFKTPRVAWAGTTIDTVFAIGGTCDDFLGLRVHFNRSEGQSGTFVANGSASVAGADHAVGLISELDDGTCGAVASYHSEEQGEVDIEITVEGLPFVKIGNPIFFLAFEDVTLQSSPELIVSERGDLTATVRGWFVGSNPSGNPARTTDDGRTLPEDRWVLPDDWQRLRGPADARPSWPGNAPMPLLDVTFFMENEGVVNSFKTGVKDGAVGWFLLDLTESSLNVNPFTGEPSKLGSVDRPRIITDLTDNDGVATVDLFGDLNLSFEGCDVNLPTGNPHCGIDDLVGITRYFAIAEYPGDRGKYPPARSNVSETQFFWAGYKEVTIEDTQLPFQKFVVAHLKDRDGFCDAIGFNNTLGTPVRFLLDSGTGIEIEVQGPPSYSSVDHRDAIGTTFDTHDHLGNPINVEIARTVLFEDECQAWIRVSSSLLKPLNVQVIFDAPPSEVPAEVRITNLVCPGQGPVESVTVTNVDDHPVSLAGFALRSPSTDIVNPEEHLELIGLLQPGESKTFLGGAGNGWQFGNDITFDDGVNEYARLVWNEFELSRVFCDGGENQPPVPAPLPKDGEGEIWIDVIVEFGSPAVVPLQRGWNLMTYSGEPIKVGEAFNGHEANIGTIYAWNPDTGRWDRHYMSGPAYVNSFSQFQPGVVYWVQAREAFTVTFGE